MLSVQNFLKNDVQGGNGSGVSKKIRSKTRTGAIVFFIIGLSVFFLPGCLAFIIGDGGIAYGIFSILASMLFIIPSIKAISERKGEVLFLEQVDAIGARESVLTAVDETKPLDGVTGCDVRLHPSFIAVRTGNHAQIWRADSIVWAYRKDNKVTSKSSVVGVTIAKSTNMQYSVELWNKERKLIAILVRDEDGANRLVNILKQVYPNVTYGYSASLEEAYRQNPLSLLGQ